MATENAIGASEVPAEALTFWQRLQIAGRYSGHPTTPTAVSKFLKIRPGAVTKYVQGKFPARKRCNELAVLHGVKSEWLFSGLGEMVAEEDLDPKILEAITILKKLPDEERERYVLFLRYVLTAADLSSTEKHRVLTEDVIRRLESEKLKRSS